MKTKEIHIARRATVQMGQKTFESIVTEVGETAILEEGDDRKKCRKILKKRVDAEVEFEVLKLRKQAAEIDRKNGIKK